MGVRQQQVAGFGQSQAPGRAVEQAAFEVVFQAPQLHADRRLGARQAQGGSAHRTGFGDGDEGS
ncbi:hypothetical protein QNM99_10040 [Pseudomonas sp. PCH446]